MTLRDALAAALERTLDPALRWTPGSTKSMCLDLSGRLLADPAFREALVEAVAEGLRGYRHGRYGPEHGTREKHVDSQEREFARAIVARMLP